MEEMIKKYIAVGGYIVSHTDGQKHYIPSHKVAKLYNVNPEECCVVDSENEIMNLPKGLIVLRPRYDGNYKLGDEK